MFARYTFADGDPARLDDVLAYIEQTILPTVKAQPGNVGLSAWVDRPSGRLMTVSAWSDLASLEASEAVVSGMRATAATTAAATTSVAVMELRLIDGVGEQQVPGHVTRVSFVSADPARLEAQQKWGRETLVPALRQVDGYLHYVVTGDVTNGSVITVATFRDEQAADAALLAAAAARAQLADLGLVIDRTEMYELAIVGIEPPPVEVPTPRLAAETQVHQQS
jgi:quinol monooxygenase YgiN